MSGDLDVPRSTCYPARHLASAAMEEGIRRTQQQSVPPQVPQVGRAAGETGASPSIRRPMLVASVAEAKKPSRGILQACPESAPTERQPAAMPHIAPAILKRRGGFSGTSKRPPLCALDPEMTMGGPPIVISGSRAHSGALALWAEKRPTPQG